MADDAFTPIVTPTPVSVTTLHYLITDERSGADSMTYRATIEMSDGSFLEKSGNVVPHLTAAELSGLQTLTARLRQKAEDAWNA